MNLHRHQDSLDKIFIKKTALGILHRIIEGVRAKNLEAILWFLDFSDQFDSKHRGNMKQILLAYSFPKETINTIIMLYKNTTATVLSLDSHTRLTHSFILKQEPQPQCLTCQTTCTVKHILIECRAFAVIRKRFFKVNSLTDQYENVKIDDILSFLRETEFYQKT